MTMYDYLEQKIEGGVRRKSTRRVWLTDEDVEMFKLVFRKARMFDKLSETFDLKSGEKK